MITYMPQLFVQTAAVVRDTLIVRTLPLDRSPAESLFFWAAGLTSLLSLLLLATLILGLFWLRRAFVAAGHRVDALFDEVRPILRQATEVSLSISKTVDLVHDEVELVKAGVQESSERVKRSVADLADRVDDFNELLGKVHTHADAVVTVAGAAVEGVAWGARKLRERRSHTKSSRRGSSRS